MFLAKNDILFIKNDKGEQRKYYNGKIGFISRIEEEAIYVICNDVPDELKVEKEVWQNIRYHGVAHSLWRRDILTSDAIPEIRSTSTCAQKREIT